VHPRLAEALRANTRELHTEVERSGVMQALLRGRIDRPTYCAMLRNLQAIYAALEDGLSRHSADPRIAPVMLAALPRAKALADDLSMLHGFNWESDLALVPAAGRYVQRLRDLNRNLPGHLVAHAYVRYLGDLSGGQILRGIVARSLGLDERSGTRFYDFGEHDPAGKLAAQFRKGLDAIRLDSPGVDALVSEALLAFSMHRELFEQLLPRKEAVCAETPAAGNAIPSGQVRVSGL